MSADTTGGGWNAALQLAAGLAGEGFDVALALLGPPPAPARRAALEAAGLRAIAVHDVAARYARCFGDMQAAGQAVSRVVNVTGADAALLHHPGLAAFGPFSAPVIVTPDSRDVIVASRSALVNGLEWRARLLRAGYQAAAATVAPTQADAGDIIATHRLRMPPRVIRRGWSAVAPATPGVDIPEYVLAIHADADGRENIAVLNEAAFLCATPVMLAGARAGALPAAGHLWALGELPPGQLQRWLAGASLFVSAATGDTDGEAVWRAADAGRPLVLADAPDYRELWDGAAVFTPPGDAVALGRALNALMADADGRRRLGAAARDRAATLAAGTCIREWAEFIRHVATVSGARRAA